MSREDKVYRPSDLQAFLKELGLSAKKRLSQNFLIDGNIIQKILHTARVSSDDFIVEIGPGPGALTQALLSTGAHVLAIEIDPVFAGALSRLQTVDDRLEIAQADILKFSLIDCLKKRHTGRLCKVVANLPYHITTPILTLLLPHAELIESLTIMVQKEFADRMQASVGTTNYSSFTVFLQCYSSVEKSFVVSPHCFHPRPKVHSAVVHCALHPSLIDKEREAFFKLTRTAFGQRRKTLPSSLKNLYGAKQVEQALLQIGHSTKDRPEQLSIGAFISLFKLLSPGPSLRNIEGAD
jgi:16S rRNA (adenine1518-N6/adenine1519-N6)-dimethyltransferase